MSRIRALMAGVPRLARDIWLGAPESVGPTQTVQDRVNRYYEACHHHYQLIWFDAKSAALHYGYHDRQIGSRTAALQRLNEVVASMVSVEPGARILDAGCGVGGSAVWLAHERHAHVDGISIVPAQIQEAGRRAQRAGISHQARFHVADFLHLPFEDNSFDIYWAIESLSHTDDKPGALREAARVTRRGGRIIVSDGFASAPMRSAAPWRLRGWTEGWAVPHLATPVEFEDALFAAGFERVCSRDVTTQVLPSSRAMAALGWWFTPPALALASAGRMSNVQLANVRSARLQYPSLRRGEWSYRLITAVKR